MPTKTLYFRKADVDIWETAEMLAKRRRQPFSGVVSALVKAWVEDNQPGGLAKEMGLSPGMKPPSHLLPPEQLRKDQIADDIRAKVRELLDEMDVVKTEIPDDEDEL